MIKKMTETFTTFASNGDPNNHEIQAQWSQIESQELPFKCLNINQHEIKMIPLPEAERLKTWNEIFAREKIETF